MGMLTLVPHNVHDITVDGHRMLVHVPSSSLFEMDAVSAAVLDLFRREDRVSAEDLRRDLGGRHALEELADCVESLTRLDILRDAAVLESPPVIQAVEDIPLSTIVLNVNTGCNLSCTYCYKEDLTTPAKGLRMGFETARQSVDLLFTQAAARDRVNVVFFGGEPLTNLPLIKQVVAYAGDKAKAEGKTVDFSLTTNATLLTEEIVDWLDAHAFALTVSMDGPKALHDLNRRTIGGQGSYDVVVDKVRMLLGRYRSRPIGARVTLTRGVTDVAAIHKHLRDELGFYEVGFGPVTSGPMTSFNLPEDDLLQVFSAMKDLGEVYVEAAIAGRNIGFSNMHQLLTDIARGTRKAVPCGAGLGMLAVDGEGDLHLCHRFVGSDQPTYGSVSGGIDVARLGAFIETAQDRTGRDCATCRIRSFCAGGCYHESYARSGDPHAPVAHYCDLMRDWVDFGVSAYTRITRANPSFLRHHVEPRSHAS
ncbi:MAG: quinohemoprotein amine dehydrogenase maturation protein [Rhodospirillum sp.]|nr:quinohemoprotein amine dehydrogenase maturation protein [Rhodospirillum sp.]MCF8490757.1 quinohemoprotein amine dehydrogenase maturation protein [Rhodospirillum sp.]MCF8502244.1 quinohemoprotein amine dehydrogenase maturation protein [Rhodospirillum sp.]